jgi:hypothetical protein
MRVSIYEPSEEAWMASIVSRKALARPWKIGHESPFRKIDVFFGRFIFTKPIVIKHPYRKKMPRLKRKPFC